MCDFGFYQDESNHRLACKAQAACAAGTKFGDSRTAPRTCPVCDAKTYQPSSHKSTTCLPWNTCGSGNKLVGASATNGGACQSCEAGTFLLDTSHQKDECVACTSLGRECQPGQKQTGCGADSQGSCTTCDTNTFQDTNSRVTVCKACTSCTAGKYLSGCAGAQGPGACPSCEAGKYLQSATNHQRRSCDDCASCNPGFRRVGCSDANPGQCVACGVGEYQDKTVRASSVHIVGLEITVVCKRCRAIF